MIMCLEEYSMTTVNNKTNKWLTSFQKRLSNKEIQFLSKSYRMTKITKIKYKSDHILCQIVFYFSFFVYNKLFCQYFDCRLNILYSNSYDFLDILQLIKIILFPIIYFFLNIKIMADHKEEEDLDTISVYSFTKEYKKSSKDID